MLVLSRRKNEKILFPSLGISIQIVQASSKHVRLGIEAPREIRVVREELDHENETQQTQFASSDLIPEETVRRELESAKLAIHLAQNQLRQGLESNAEEALDQAIICLRQLENQLSGNQQLAAEAVHESRSGYQTSHTTLPIIEIVADVFQL